MEESGGQIAAKRAKPTEDRLSALQDDLLLEILVRLDSTAEAVRTSVLARRWRNLWRSVWEVRLDPDPDAHRIRVLLDAPGAPDLERLSITTEGAGPDSAAAWLPAAARRLTGALVYRNVALEKDAVDGEEAAAGIQLPCFEKATKIELNLGFLGLALPSVGVFNSLTDLCLINVRFCSPDELGNAVSSSRCPCLRKLGVCNTRGLETLTIHSESLLQIRLIFVIGLLKLTVGAPALQELEMTGNIGNNQLVADISTPQLVSLMWKAAFDSQYVNLGNLDQLQMVGSRFIVFGEQDCREQNHRWLSLLHRFQVLRYLYIELLFLKELDGFQYLMGDITVLPQTMVLQLVLDNWGHSFGAGSFHLLRMCTALRRLILVLNQDYMDLELQEESMCSSGCICDQPTSWKTEELALNHLECVVIGYLQGDEQEVTFVKQLFKWAVVLKKMRIIFNYKISESEAREIRQALVGFSRPETYVEFCMLRNRRISSMYLLPPEGQVAGL